MKKVFLSLILITFHCVLFCQDDAQKEKDDPLSFLEDMIGNWYYHPDVSFLKTYPQLKDQIVKKFEWADDRKKFINFYEGVSDDDVSTAVLTCQIAANLKTGMVQFQGYQARNDFYYYGRFEPLEEGKGYTWTYDVYYPENMQFDDEIDKKKGYITYRTTCKISDENSMGCTTDQLKLGRWKPFMTAGEIKYIRK